MGLKGSEDLQLVANRVCFGGALGVAGTGQNTGNVCKRKHVPFVVNPYAARV